MSASHLLVLAILVAAAMLLQLAFCWLIFAALSAVAGRFRDPFHRVFRWRIARWPALTDRR
jgi:hypothetical protein